MKGAVRVLEDNNDYDSILKEMILNNHYSLIVSMFEQNILSIDQLIKAFISTVETFRMGKPISKNILDLVIDNLTPEHSKIILKSFIKYYNSDCSMDMEFINILQKGISNKTIKQLLWKLPDEIFFTYINDGIFQEPDEEDEYATMHYASVEKKEYLKKISKNNNYDFLLRMMENVPKNQEEFYVNKCLQMNDESRIRLCFTLLKIKMTDKEINICKFLMGNDYFSIDQSILILMNFCSSINNFPNEIKDLMNENVKSLLNHVDIIDKLIQKYFKSTCGITFNYDGLLMIYNKGSDVYTIAVMKNGMINNDPQIKEKYEQFYEELMNIQ